MCITFCCLEKLAKGPVHVPTTSPSDNGGPSSQRQQLLVRVRVDARNTNKNPRYHSICECDAQKARPVAGKRLCRVFVDTDDASMREFHEIQFRTNPNNDATRRNTTCCPGTLMAEHDDCLIALRMILTSGTTRC